MRIQLFIKTAFATLVIFFTSYSLKSQINVGPIVNVKMKNTGTFKPEDLKALKESRTIFLVGTELSAVEMILWDSAIRSGWNYTPIEVMTFKEFGELGDYSGLSFFMVSGHSTVNGSTITAHFYLTLSIMKGNKQLDFCRIEMFTDYPSYSVLYDDIWKKSKSFNKHFYNESVIYNWNPGIMKNNLQVVNKCLTNREQRWIFGKEVTPEISKLKTATLYIPEYCLIDYNKWNGDASKRHDPEELLKDYKGNYEFISDEDLKEKIMDDDEPFYYLLYVRSCTDKYFTIINSQTGKIVYTAYSPAQYNLKDKDFKNLQNVIDNQ